MRQPEPRWLIRLNLSRPQHPVENRGDPRRAVATVFSVMRNVSVPMGSKIPAQPNIADTLWLTVADQKNKVYSNQDTNSPSIIWADLSKLDFSEGSGPRRLPMDGGPDLAGDQTANFQPMELLQFMSPDAPHE
jgi:penicillin V acylase-like amidase (Ntn superfamily)